MQKPARVTLHAQATQPVLTDCLPEATLLENVVTAHGVLYRQGRGDRASVRHDIGDYRGVVRDEGPEMGGGEG